MSLKDRACQVARTNLQTAAAFKTYALCVHVHFCVKWRGHYPAIVWIHLVVFACLYDPFVYSGMARGTEGAGCFVFAPFNMLPWRSYYCAVMITFEWKATSSGRGKKKEPQAGLIFFSDLKPYTEWPSPLSGWICGFVVLYFKQIALLFYTRIAWITF